MSIRTVMFATDFSAASEAALGMAREIAEQSGASIHAVHVVPGATVPSQAAELMTELTRRLGLEEPLHTALLSGRPAREIVRYAQDHGVDLIVVGTHGRTGVTRVLLGSVAEAVVRLSSCPVLAVPSAAWPVEAPALRLPTSDATPHFCVVCVRETDDLICETCRSKIRGEARERKPEADREG